MDIYQHFAVRVICPECDSEVALEPWTMRVPLHFYQDELRTSVICPLTGYLLELPSPIRLA